MNLELDNNNKYIIEARRIITLLKSDFVLDNGALCLNIHDDYKSPFHIFPDLGDILPFLIYFREDEFIEQQIKVFKQTLKDGILFSEFPTFRIKGLAKSYEYSDLLLGLIDYNNFKKNIESKDLLLDNINKAIDIFKFNNNFCSFYWHKFKINLPVKDSRDGMMIELFVEIYNICKDKKYLDIAYNIYNKLTSTSFYRKHNIFPTFSANRLLSLFSEKFRQGKLGKCNTNTLFAMLSLYQAIKDDKILNSIIKTVKNIQDKATVDKGGLVAVYIPASKIKQACLTPSFAMLDFLCDFYHVYNRQEDLDFAKDIAEYWINLQHKNGLFPLFNDKVETFIDSETDMSVALYKLYELTNDNKYKDSADKCLEGIITMHGKYDYVLSIDINSGKVLNGSKKSKFLTLFLKLLILKYELLQSNCIYKDKKLFNLLKDR